MIRAGSIVVLSCVLLVHIMFTAPALAQTQFVTMRGRDFIVDGQPFYPRVMNFGLEITTNTNGTADPALLYITPEGAYDKDVHNYFECGNWNECSTQLLEHFAKVISMGFNTVRIVSDVVARPVRQTGGAYGYQITVHPNIPYSDKYRLELGMPNFSDPLSQRYFTILRHVLDVADSAGLKVILLAGGGVEKGPGMGPDALQYDAIDAQHYAEFLAALGTALQGHPALLAYDLWNEPIWANVGATNLSKQTVCDFTSQWYDVLKAHDPEHLVTLGGYSVSEVGSWDPAVMKLDFYSPHIYPDVHILDGYELTRTFQRVQDELYWLGADCPMPWLIGETSFSADDGTTDYLDDPFWDDLDALPEHHQMPWMQGSENDQVNYATMSMNATRNFRGSGYSWWAFQNVRQPPYQSNDPEGTRTKYFGWLGYGDGNQQQWKDKLVVNALSSYVLPPAPTALPQPPAGYASWFSDGGEVYRQYTIEDEDTNEPIQHALATVEWRYETVDPDDDGVVGVWDRNTTDASGQVNIRKRDATNIAYAPPVAKRLFFDASGAEHRAYDPDNGVPWPEGYSNISLVRTRLYMDDALTAHTVPINGEEVHAAWSSLTLSDVVVEGDGSAGGTADFKARELVHAQAEFHAQRGAEVHLFTEPTFLDCAEQVVGMAPKAQAGQRWFAASPVVVPKKLVLNFVQPHVEVSVFPNPCTISLQVVLDEGAGHCRISTAAGAIVYESTTDLSMHVVDVSRWAAGDYSVRVTTIDGEQVTTITKL